MVFALIHRFGFEIGRCHMAMVIVSTENIPGTNWRYGRPSLWLVAARAGKPRLSDTLIDVEQREAGKLMGDFSHLPSTNVPLLISIPHIHPTSERNHHHPKKEAIFLWLWLNLRDMRWLIPLVLGLGSYHIILSYHTYREYLSDLSDQVTPLCSSESRPAVSWFVAACGKIFALL